MNELPKKIIDYKLINLSEPFKYDGSLILLESVENSTVEATGNIIVHGSCGNCTLISKTGSVFLLYGSMQMTHIRAGQNIYVKHSMNSELHAGNDIILENSIYMSNLTAGNKIICEAANAKIVGGSTQAFREINVDVYGSNKNIDTELIIGDPKGIIIGKTFYKGVILNIGMSKHKILKPVVPNLKFYLRKEKIIAESLE